MSQSRITPEIAGGKAIIEGTRVTVADIVARHQPGSSFAETAATFATISEDAVRAALAYYRENRDEIDAVFAEYDALERSERWNPMS